MLNQGALAAVALIAALGHVGDLRAQVPDSLLALDSLDVVDPSTLSPPRQGLPEAVQVHLSHLMTAFYDTPGGMGLIDTGMAEAEIAAEYVRIAGSDSTALGNMTRNMAHVLHAIDPNQVGSGFGLGYGFRHAAEGVRMHAELAAAEPGATETVLFHAPFVARAATGAIARADEAIAMARRVQQARTAAEARPLVRSLARLVRAMAYGDDRDRDGRIGYAANETGLAQATYHLKLVYRVEGLPIPTRVVPGDTVPVDTLGIDGAR